MPSSVYNVYCSSEDFNGNGMPFGTVKNNGVQITTACCREISSVMSFSSILEYSDTSPSAPSVFQFALDAPPSIPITVYLSAIPHVCGWSVRGVAPLASIIPSTFRFSPTSLSLVGRFIVRGTPGCFNISISEGSGLYFNSTINVAIRSLFAAPDPPVLVSAILSRDGGSMTISFNEGTDRGGYGLGETFPCGQLLRFTQAADWNCLWTSSTDITASYFRLSSSAFVEVGGLIALSANAVKAICPANRVCAPANVSTTILQAPSNPIAPSMSLSSPSTISFCNAIILDATGSTGQGARPWSAVTWSVTGTNASLITMWLNQMYGSTQSVAVVPNRLLAIDSFTFTLMLTNFLEQSSAARVRVSVVGNGSIPQVVIGGPSTVFTFRPNPLTLTATGSVTQCGGVSADIPGLQYVWSLRAAGDPLQSTSIAFKSQSLNPRSLSLAPFSLNASTGYLVTVEVIYVNGGSRSVASTSVFVQVGESGVRAIIAGGSVQTSSAQLPITIDASSSYDVDYPSSKSLKYIWACVEIAPDFGMECPNAAGFARSGELPILTMQPNQLNVTAQKSLNITVFVTNAIGSVASTSLLLILVSEAIPIISIAPFSSRQIIGRNIILSGSIRTMAPAVAVWSSSSVALASASLTPTEKTVGAGTTFFQLAVDTSTFGAGLSYWFQLGATYDLQPGAPINAFAQVAVKMNSPPIGGVVTVSPSRGIAFNTTFRISTGSWTTDPSNYPIVYVLQHLPNPNAPAVVLKTIGPVTFVDSLLSQGMAFSNYLTTCTAVAADILGSASDASSVVIVTPPEQVNTKQLTDLASTAIQSALTNNDPAAVAFVVAAVSAALNAVNCSVPRKCASINRQECSTTPHTCGPCLGGYIGASGDSNIPCGEASKLSRIGERCESNVDCLSGRCAGGACSDVQKQCPGACSNRGSCQYLDLMGQPTSSCSASSSYCTAVCNCMAASFGSDCSLSLSALDELRASRTTLCVGMYRTLGLQDVTADVVAMRSSTIASVLLDMSQITDNALSNCTAALVGTITKFPSLAGSPATANLCAQALSNVLAKGSDLPPSLAANVSEAMTALALGMQSNMAIGQPFNTLSTVNTRLSTGLVYASDIASQQFSPPQSSAEVFERVPNTIVSMNTSSDGGVGVSLVQFNNNALNATTAVSPGIGIQSFTYSISESGQRRLLDTTNNSLDMSYTFTVPNFYSVDYFATLPIRNSVQCVRSLTPYTIAVACPSGGIFNVTCPAQSQGVQNYTCPATSVRPQCDEYVGNRFVASPTCRVVAFSSSATTCRCGDGAMDGGRRLAQSSAPTRQYSTSASIVTSEFTVTFQSTKNINLKSVEKNKVVLIVMSMIVGLFLIGLFCLVKIDYNEMQRRQIKFEKEVLSAMPVGEFLDLAMPAEFSDTPWFFRLWNKLLVEHEWVCLLGSFDAKKDLRMAVWTKAMVRLIQRPMRDSFHTIYVVDSASRSM